MSVEKQMPPRWAKDAVASPQGWTPPRTKALLVARRGLVVDEVVEKTTRNAEKLFGK